MLNRYSIASKRILQSWEPLCPCASRGWFIALEHTHKIPAPDRQYPYFYERVLMHCQEKVSERVSVYRLGTEKTNVPTLFSLHTTTEYRPATAFAAGVGLGAAGLVEALAVVLGAAGLGATGFWRSDRFLAVTFLSTISVITPPATTVIEVYQN